MQDLYDLLRPHIREGLLEGGETVKKIDRLLEKLRYEQQLSGNVFESAIIAPAYLMEEPEDSPNYNRWMCIAHIKVNRGTMTETKTSYHDTRDEALRWAHEIEAANQAVDGEGVIVYMRGKE